MYTVVVQQNGFFYSYGPFKGRNEAMDWAIANVESHDYHIALHSPEGLMRKVD